MIMRAILTLLSLGVFAVISKATGSPWNEEQRWVSEKLDPARYDVATRPVKNIADAVNVTVEMVLVKIVGLDSKTQLLTAVTSSNMGWEDKRLSWNTSEYSGMESIVVQANMVWYPNVLILNAIDENTLIPSDTEVLVTSEGELFVRAQRTHDTQCFLKQELFPFDTQDCLLVLGTRGAPSDVIALTASQYVQSPKNIGSNANWELESVLPVEGYSVECIKHRSALDGEVQCQRSSQIVLALCLHRVPKYYMYTIMAPTAILTMLASIVFWLPPECGEKLSFGVSVFFGFVIFQLVLENDLADAGNGKPSILVRYELCNFTLTGVALLVSAFTLILRNKTDDHDAAKDRHVTSEETLQRNGDVPRSQDDEVTRYTLQSAKRVHRNWKQTAVYVDRISFVLFWIAYAFFLIPLIVEVAYYSRKCE
ncbi:acetylcholine receptor subunit beta-like [Asterias rubens]|uniref:acetylcholine receptor subunit beta-like n=1 Tax=Asterias rubens TaxID=7604 RepID=UPI001454F977|nr:acetylcholine receptor subunit beta-like [Asterias rubens]XP_033643475.1 acetylcholine receptor subunit beta-like [Asterias rubens]